MLNHVDGGSRATKVSDRYSQDSEERVALETWQRRLKAMLENKPVSTVVPSRRQVRNWLDVYAETD